ncbi:MAG: phosphatidylglycerophosphatase A [Nitrospirota bacterium]|nr:phosphatidylglycerophosphatase A [Nitrospirota bacterium]
MNRAAVFIATGGGAGYSPWAPGTAGSLVGILPALLLSQISPIAGLGLIIAVTLAGVWASSVAEKHFDKKDASPIVIDEIAGQMITLWLVPPSVGFVVAGFLLFRFFDILKPFPARQLQDNLPGGWGVMMDDVAAGIYANLCLQIALRFIV